MSDETTPEDLIRYDLLVQRALRRVVRSVLTDTMENGLPGNHHFFITFRTDYPGVIIADHIRAKHPEEITIALQHQFWDMKVTDDIFEVGLSFGGLPEKLIVPFDALTGFWDPSVDFGLKFEMSLEELEGEDDEETQDEASSAQDKDKAALEEGHTASVVSLDAFRKKT
jgi:hypothetical protein